MSVYIGIDPGLKGGFAALDDDGGWLGAWPMPLIGGEIDSKTFRHLLFESTYYGEIGRVIVEKVHAMPKQGVASTFKFGYGLGKIVGIIEAEGFPLELATPQRWKAAILRDTDKSKEAAIAYCARRWPGVRLVQPGCRKPHDGIADALCLAEFGWRRFARQAV